MPLDRSNRLFPKYGYAVSWTNPGFLALVIYAGFCILYFDVFFGGLVRDVVADFTRDPLNDLITDLNDTSPQPVSCGPFTLCGAFTALMCSAGATVLIQLSHFCGVRIANREARRILTRIQQQPDLPWDNLCLYLRPHWLDSRSVIENPFYQGGHPWVPDFFNLRLVTVDQLLSQILDSPTIALGTKRMSIATGSVNVSDSVWKTVVAKLVRCSSVIVYVPDETLGMSWEMEEIQRQGATKKMILFQPPESAAKAIQHKTSLTYWQTLEERFQVNFGIKLPDFDSRGSAIACEKIPTSVALRAVTEITAALQAKGA